MSAITVRTVGGMHPLRTWYRNRAQSVPSRTVRRATTNPLFAHTAVARRLRVRLADGWGFGPLCACGGDRDRAR